MNHEVAIDLQEVGKVFHSRAGSVTAIKNASFTVNKGEFLSLLGPSGCGKTTLMRMVAGLDYPTAGSVKSGGQEVVGPQEGVGVVFQSPALMAWRSALANILLPTEIVGLPRSEALKRAREMLQLVGLEHFQDKYPHELSGGMQQRVGIARALVSYPKILLLDEPFSALDAMTRNQLNVELLRIWSESRITTMLVTHSISEAVFLSDRVVILSGRPCEVNDIVEIDLPRPRTAEIRVDAKFLRIVDKIGRAVGLEYA